MHANMHGIHSLLSQLILVCLDAAQRGVQPDQIIFTDVAMKHEHIRRSSLADLFLDTYNSINLSSSLELADGQCALCLPLSLSVILVCYLNAQLDL
jgi:hypothetical protein